MPHIKYMIVTSYYTAFCLEKYCGRKATVIHPVIIQNDEQAKTKAKEGVVGSDNSKPSSPVVLFSHGRLEPGKGFDTLVKIWKELNNKEKPEQKPQLEKGIVDLGNE